MSTKLKVETKTVIQRDWRGKIISKEVKRIYYRLHPTKGWKRVGATNWAKDKFHANTSRIRTN